MNINAERFAYKTPLRMGEDVFHVREMIPYDDKEQMAQDYVGAAMVFDEESGIAYEGYNEELIRAFLILTHYTDLDLSQYDTPQGRNEIYDIIASHGLWKEITSIVDEDVSDVDVICYKLQSAARRSFERKHSLEYRVGKVFENLLGTENLSETVAKAEGLNGKLIDLIGALQRQQASVVPVGPAGMRLSKKG